MKTLNQQLEADILTIERLSDDEDDKQTMLAELLSGKPLHKAIRHTRAECARDRRWCGITPPNKTKKEKESGTKTLAPKFHYFDHVKNDGDMSTHESLVENSDTTVEIHYSRAHTAAFDKQTETILSLMRGGGAALGRGLGLTGRRGQQICRAMVDRAATEACFKLGNKGQGGLFGFDGGVEK